MEWLTDEKITSYDDNKEEIARLRLRILFDICSKTVDKVKVDDKPSQQKFIVFLTMAIVYQIVNVTSKTKNIIDETLLRHFFGSPGGPQNITRVDLEKDFTKNDGVQETTGQLDEAVKYLTGTTGSGGEGSDTPSIDEVAKGIANKVKSSIQIAGDDPNNKLETLNKHLKDNFVKINLGDLIRIKMDLASVANDLFGNDLLNNFKTGGGGRRRSGGGTVTTGKKKMTPTSDKHNKQQKATVASTKNSPKEQPKKNKEKPTASSTTTTSSSYRKMTMSPTRSRKATTTTKK